LLYLIRLGEAALGLEIENLGNACVSEDVVAPFDPFRKSQSPKKTPEIGETDVSVRSTAKDLK
jgi:hypothetical protein